MKSIHLMVFIKQQKNTILFLGFLLLAGILNLLTRTANLMIDTLMTSLHDMIFIGLLLFWLQSVRTRLLTSTARTYIVCIACLMLLYLLVRIFKYNIVIVPVLARYAVYSYWIPQMLIPALFLMVCICISSGELVNRKWDEKLLLIPGILLSLLVLTNDLHGLVYKPKIELTQFKLETGTYTYGFGFYLLYAFMIVAALIGLILLVRETGHRSAKAIGSLLIVILLWFVLVLVNLLIIDKQQGSRRLFSIPEVHIFSMLGFIEVTIRYRLIPHNENYTGFLQKLRIPTLITDRQFQPVYSSEAALSADRAALQQSLERPLVLPGALKLYGKNIRAGYAFWTEDEAAVRSIQQNLREANETIEQENDLIRAETEQKAQDAYLQTRHHIYHVIAEELYPRQIRIGQILDQAEPGTAEFRNSIARVSVLNAYVKRKTNLLLLAAEHESLSSSELYLSLQESASYLTCAGLQTTVWEPEEKLYPAHQLISLYDTFEILAEQLVEKTSALMISWNPDGLCLAASVPDPPYTENAPLPVQLRREEDILYMDILTEKGGAVI